jgi:SOS-response transcriptional repressor LexA
MHSSTTEPVNKTSSYPKGRKVEPLDEPQPLSERQRECLTVIVDHFQTYMRAPSLREIAVAMGIKSTNGVSDHLKCLLRKGYILWDESVSRGIRPVGLTVSYVTPDTNLFSYVPTHERELPKTP